MWTCPRCERSFGRQRAHVCEAGMPVEIRLMEFPESQREAAEAVLSLARRHKGVVVEAVGVGIFLKRDRTLVELRPKTKWLDVSFVTPDTVTSARIARSGKLAHGHWYVVHVAGKRDVDAELRGWLTASLRSAATKRT